MEMLIVYLKVFLVGGVICTIGQVLINTTKMTSSRILVIFLLIGVILETAGLYDYIIDFGKAGATTPISGFGAALAKGAKELTIENGILGAISGGLEAVSAGIASVILIAFVVGLIAKSKTK